MINYDQLYKIIEEDARKKFPKIEYKFWAGTKFIKILCGSEKEIFENMRKENIFIYPPHQDKNHLE